MSTRRLAMLLGTTLALGATLDVPTSPVRTPRRREDEPPPARSRWDVVPLPPDLRALGYGRPPPLPDDGVRLDASQIVTRGPTHNPGRLTRRERRRRAGR